MVYDTPAIKFPSLTGVIHFLSCQVWIYRISIFVFPSLTGVIHFLTTVAFIEWLKTSFKFPSLTGVIHFLKIMRLVIRYYRKKFPSLTGVIHFLIYPLKPAWLLGSKRVLRGKIIFDWKLLIYIIHTCEKRRFYLAFQLCG